MQQANEQENGGHLESARLLDHLLDGNPLAEREQSHLDACDACRAEMVALQELALEMRIMALSDVSDATLARYDGLVADAIPVRESPLQRFGRWVTGQLVFDSRTQLLSAGLRSGAGSSYRLLYGTSDGEIELLVEVEQGVRRIEGEFVTDASTPVLVQLSPVSPAWAPFATQEAVGSADGRFRFVGVRPGRFSLTVSVQDGTTIHLPDVEIA